MCPLFLTQVLPFLQTKNLWACSASQPDISSQGMAWRNPFLLYAAPQVSPISALMRNFSTSLHFSNLLPIQPLLPLHRASSAQLVSLAPALQMKLLSQIRLRPEPKLPLGLFALSTCFCKPILCPAKRCGWPQDKTDCCQDPERLLLISAHVFFWGWGLF